MQPDAGDMIPLAHSYLFTPGFGFEEASNPMNRYSNVRHDLSQQQISPAWGFAKYFSEHVPGATAGLIVNARGATPIEEWLKGETLYIQTVERTKQAFPWGDLKAILWHQGEGNSTRPQSYMANLQKLVADLRAEFSTPDAFFLAGELNYIKPQQYGALNDSLHTIQTRIPHSDWVSAEGLTTLADDIHFDRQSAITLGERYAQKIIPLFYTSIPNVQSGKNKAFSIENRGEYIVVNGVEQTASLAVYDICGRKLLSENIPDGYSLILPRKGIYLFSIADSRSVLQTKICVK
jgi:hypothetical protein